MPVRTLSVHAGYRCRQSGACCSGVFAIPAEPHVMDVVGTLDMEASRGSSSSLFVRPPEAEGRAFVGAGPDGSCVFFESENGRLCTLHRRAGTGALPSACRHFPRVFLRDGRGIFLSLSHFCPTAAALLLEEGQLAIVDAESPLALDGAVEAFEAVDALPPLLRPDLVMDLASYGAWERAAVATFAREDLTHDEAIALIGSATDVLRRWTVAGGALEACVSEAFREAGARPLTIDDHQRDPLRLALVGGPADVAHASWEELVTPAWNTFDRPVKRYVAAKLFGNRIAYECRGLRSIVEWLRVCLALLRCEAMRAAQQAGAPLDRELFIEAVRAADLLLVHRLDSQSLASRLESIERQPERA